MDRRLFLYFYSFLESSKISGFDRRAELVVKQLTQFTNYAIKFKVVNNGGRDVFT